MGRITPIRVVVLMLITVVILALVGSFVSCTCVNITENEYYKQDTIYQQDTVGNVYIIELDTIKVPYKPRPVMIPNK